MKARFDRIMKPETIERRRLERIAYQKAQSLDLLRRTQDAAQSGKPGNIYVELYQEQLQRCIEMGYL